MLCKYLGGVEFDIFLWETQVLKQDINASRLRAIAPLIGGTVGVDYMRSAFATRYQLTTAPSFVEVTDQLPKTVIWFTEALKGLEQEKRELETSLAPVQESLQNLPLKPTGKGIPPPSVMRTGGRLGVSTGLSTTVSSVGPASSSGLFILFSLYRNIVDISFQQTARLTMCVWEPACPGEKRFSEVQWKCDETLVRLGLLQILRSNEAANMQSIAETLALNTARLHDYQNSFQQILVIATGSVFHSSSDLTLLTDQEAQYGRQELLAFLSTSWGDFLFSDFIYFWINKCNVLE